MAIVLSQGSGHGGCGLMVTDGVLAWVVMMVTMMVAVRDSVLVKINMLLRYEQGDLSPSKKEFF